MNILKYIPITLAFLAAFTSYPVNAQQSGTSSRPQPVPPSGNYPTAPSIPQSNNSTTVPQSAYAEFMRLGYAAMQRKDYSLAAQYFRQALYYVPSDRAATIAYWNARDEITKQDNNVSQQETNYDRYMRIAYDATEKADYQTALINFQRALEERPNDYYATQGMRNVNTYINRGEGSSNAQLNTEPTFYIGESAYDRYMRLGYAAQQRKDYTTAANYFRSALYERPNDRLATVAFWNVQDVLKNGKQENRATQGESDYDRYMRLGYDATERGDYPSALTYFRQALSVRPNDEYAIRAIRNVTAYEQNARGTGEANNNQ
ncbi:tetratricopeptide repeat protein [Gloeothece verrucosa]|uniref:TPR repeat-containing protein n=1 Tax=Gloeothece verrucosa (strain PCC 7822) TaxID=497965 RepID=E0ULV3_GLOV7|nr:hypothetical protein [Gloeothece verrucosa]ADN17933.1 TPR repeat-containing protein [Gloeothece verrucosa PCC 7822]